MQRPHIVEAIGQLHEQDAYVLAHGKYELAEVLGLLCAIALQLEPGQLRYAIDEPCYSLAKAPLDLGEGERCILDRVVQERRDEASSVEPVACEDIGDGQRMGDIGVTVLTAL